MLGRVLSLVAALLLSCASTGAHAYARPLQPENAHRGFAATEHDAQREQARVTAGAASENSPAITEPSDGRRFYAKARYYSGGRGSFLSVDPWSGDQTNPLSYNKYLYAYANPGGYIDPDGRCAGPLIFLCLGAIGAELGFFGSVISQEITEGKNLATVDYKRAGTEAVIGGVSGAAGAGFVAAGVRTSLAVAGGVTTDTLLSTGGDAINAAPGEFVTHESLQTNLTVSTVGVFAGTAGGLIVDAGGDFVKQGWKYASRVRSGDAVTVRESPSGNSADSFYDPAMVEDLEDAYRAAGRYSSDSSRPEWLRAKLEAGEDFNRRQRVKFKFNEVYVENACDGGSCLRLDSYRPPGEGGGSGEIVSRKFTQLAEIQPETASKYLREIERKYAPGTMIADVPTTRAAGLAGQRLRGQMYLDVPTQNAPVPQGVLDEARRRDIRIRDESGNEL